MNSPQKKSQRPTKNIAGLTRRHSEYLQPLGWTGKLLRQSSLTRWRFQRISNMLVNLDDLPRQSKNETCLKPPPREGAIYNLHQVGLVLFTLRFDILQQFKKLFQVSWIMSIYHLHQYFRREQKTWTLESRCSLVTFHFLTAWKPQKTTYTRGNLKEAFQLEVDYLQFWV